MPWVSDSGPDNPFEGLPFLGDLAKMLQSSGPVSWDAARQFAVQVATDGQSEANPDPIERIRFEELVRVADLQVANLTGLATSTTGRVVTVVPDTLGYRLTVTFASGWRAAALPIADGIAPEGTPGVAGK